MAGVLISLIISFAIIFIITRVVWIRIINGEFLLIELHLPIFALVLKKKNSRSDKKQKKKEKRLSALTYVRIISKMLRRFKKCEVLIKRVTPPQKPSEFGYSTMIKPYGYQSLIYTLIAYLETKVEKLTLEENAVNFIPGNSLFLCDIIIKARFYEIAFAVFCLYRNIKKEKRITFS